MTNGYKSFIFEVKYLTLIFYFIIMRLGLAAIFLFVVAANALPTSAYEESSTVILKRVGISVGKSESSTSRGDLDEGLKDYIQEWQKQRERNP